MVRKKIGLMGILILSVLAFADTRSALVLVPNDLNAEDVKVLGIIKSGNDESQIYYKQKLDSLGEAVTDIDGNIVIEKSGNVTLAESDKYIAYGSTKYLEMSLGGLEPTDDVKFMLGYESGEEDGVPRYTIISSSDIKNNTDIQDAFEDSEDPIVGLDMLDFGRINSYDNYDTFPGKELTKEESLYSGFVVGDKVMEDTSDPSNIVDIYYAQGDPEDAINVVDGGASINPTVANQNNTFEVWVVKTDADGNILYETVDGEEVPIRVLIYSNTGEEDTLYSDFREDKKEGIEFEEGQWFPSDDLVPPFGEDHEYFVFDISVRFQNDPIPAVDADGNFIYDEKGKQVMVAPSLYVNGEDVLTAGNYRWTFENVSELTLDYLGKNEFIFNLGGQHVIIIPDDGQYVPPAIAQKVYVMEDDGKLIEGEMGITSTYENTVKTRKSNIIMKVMTESGTTEKNYEIENIEE